MYRVRFKVSFSGPDCEHPARSTALVDPWEFISLYAAGFVELIERVQS